ncbi:MAG: 4Fe-4S dicluster domain-containing protein [Eggerthellaceae bacterium]|jgi:carbon-monoxide dehydrogenase iron sulfur subunit|nr:4Fe-4S dicluster domain-containing protein [Eggerthellaceae bacterium]MCH4221106.1 4Fe-4S dicluster domain-containing protein [Eggerthellaceae bacterium]
MKRIYAIESWCIDCKRCEVACRTAHSKSKDPVKAYKVEHVPGARIHVEGDQHVSIAVNCRQCPKPACVDACISGAMQRDPETGIITSDPERCVGCRTCVSECPFGCIHVESVALKCDLCGDGHGEPGEPACVAVCPNRALIYVESEGCHHGE